MLNSQRFSRYFGVVTVVCITSLLVSIGGCSTSQTPDSSSPSPEAPSSDLPSPDNAVEPKQPETSTNTTNRTLAEVKQYEDVPQVFQGVWQADLEQCSSQASETRLEIGSQQIQFYESQGAD